MNVGLIFGIIFAVIVMGFLLFFGIQYFGEMTEAACKSQLGKQITDLENSVRSTLSLSQGSVQKLRLMVPSCYEKICFVDPEHPDRYPEGDWDPEEHVKLIARDEGRNVVVYKSSGLVKGYTMDKLKAYVNFCVSSSKEVSLVNTGRQVEITLPEFR